jgi:hypothetical protein
MSSLIKQLSPFVSRHLPLPKLNYKDNRNGGGFNSLAYLRAWNRSDEYPSTSGKQEILQARYQAARLSVAPALFSKSNPPPKGKIPVVDRKKAVKLRRQRIRSRMAAKSTKKRRDKHLKKKLFVSL